MNENVSQGDIVVIGQVESKGRPIDGPPLAEWLLGEGRGAASPAALIDELCWRLVGRDIPVWRASVSLPTLHPQARAYGFRWRRDPSGIEEFTVPHNILDSQDYRESPLRPLIERGRPVRYRLDDPESIRAYPLLQSLAAAGGTDYYACSLSNHYDRPQITTWATDRPGGFSPGQFDVIQGLLPVLSAVIDGLAMRRVAGTLLDIYLGPTIGRRILGGEVRRGHGERLRAVLMAIDLRGFTSLSDRLPPDDLIGMLDAYFDIVAGAIAEQGGEVLKFVGDGVLAIFPTAEGEERSRAVAGLAAAEAILQRLAAANDALRAAGKPLIRIGIGLHIGEVYYGNVGAADRLDFTAIGPAVNLVCRLEGLTKRFGRPLLLSQEFAALSDRTLFSLGFQPVKGLGEPAEVFGLG
jgi:adenylate cyclase